MSSSPPLYAETTGSGSRVVLVHGFSQNRGCWGPIADALSISHEVVRVDAPGHGRSSAVSADIVDGAGLLADTGGRAAYVGYSMGGRLCLRLAVDHPEVVRALILVGATPGIVNDTERRARRVADRELAARIEHIGVEAFVEEWLRDPLFAGLADTAAHRQERLENTASGLADSLRLAGVGSQAPLWLRLPELTMPVLVVAGARDTKFVAIAVRMAKVIGASAELALVPDSGHTAHLEQPRKFVRVVRRFLADMAQRAG